MGVGALVGIVQRVLQWMACSVNINNSSSNRVCNDHTRMFHALPNAPRDHDLDDPVVAMIVDTSVSAHSVQLVLGEFATHNCRTDNWEQPRKNLDCSLEFRRARTDPTCAHSNGFLHITGLQHHRTPGTQLCKP